MAFISFRFSLILAFFVVGVFGGPPKKTTPRNPWKATTLGCTCNKDITELRTRVDKDSAMINELRGVLDTYTSEMNALKGTLKNLNGTIHKKATGMAEKLTMLPEEVAFSAKAGYNLELQSLDTVIFSSVQTNKGKHYNEETGKFTAPERGTYFFFSSILSGYNTKIETAIVVNGNEITRMYSGAHDAHGSGSNGVVTDLKAGDEVWVQVLYQGGNHVHGFYSTFSGYMIGRT